MWPFLSSRLSKLRLFACSCQASKSVRHFKSKLEASEALSLAFIFRLINKAQSERPLSSEPWSADIICIIKMHRFVFYVQCVFLSCAVQQFKTFFVTETVWMNMYVVNTVVSEWHQRGGVPADQRGAGTRRGDDRCPVGRQPVHQQWSVRSVFVLIHCPCFLGAV